MFLFFIFGGNFLEYTKSVGEKKENMLKENMLKYLGEVFFPVLFTSGLNDSMISQSFGWKETPSFGKLSSHTTKLIGLLRGGAQGEGVP